MTQAIIPGCEENPDPKDVINVTQKENNTMDNNEDKFDALLVSAANAAESGKNLVKENDELSNELEDMVRRNHELYDEVEQLRSANEDLTADNQVLKDELEEQRAKPSGLTPRAVLPTIEHGLSLCVRKKDWVVGEAWKIDGKCGEEIVAVLEKAKFVNGFDVLDNATVTGIEVFADSSMVGGSSITSIFITVNAELN